MTFAVAPTKFASCPSGEFKKRELGVLFMRRRTFLAGATATAALTGTGMVASLDVASAKSAALGPLLDPWSGPHGGVPPFNKVKVAGFKPALAKGMDLMRAEIKAIAGDKAAPTFDNTVIRFEDAGRPFGRAVNFFGIFTSTMNDKATQKIEAEMSPKLAAFDDEIIQNEALFARLKAVYDTRTTAGLDAQQQRLADVHYTRFARRGAALNAAQKKRLQAINQRLASLFTKFSQNQLGDEEHYTLVIDDAADLAGLPDSIRASAAQAAKDRGRAGKWVFTNVIAHPAAAGSDIPARVRRMASSAPMARRRAVSMTLRISA